MRKNQVRDVIVHVPENADMKALAGRISRFHAEVIGRRLEHAACSTQQKIAFLEQIISEIQSS